MRQLGAHLVRNGDRYALAAYLVSTVAFLQITTLVSHRAWAQAAIGAYVVALVVSLIPRARPAAGWIAALGSVAVPLVILAARDVAQPEVHVLSDGARSLLATGTPYHSSPGTLDDYRPYLPLLFAFGLPRALGLDSPLGDPRLWIAAAFVASVLVGARPTGPQDLPDRSRSLLPLFLAMPLLAMTLAVSAIDLPMTAAATLAVLAVSRRNWALAALASGAATAMKPTMGLLVVLLAVELLRTHGVGRSLRYLLPAALTAGLLVVPVLVADPEALWASVVSFPAGLEDVESPAQSPFPGVLLAAAGGQELAFALMSAGALAWVVHAWRRPTTDYTALAYRVAGAFTTVYLLAPASRAGYLVLPLTLLFVGWARRPASTPHITSRATGSGASSRRPRRP
ncbi:glycosyltransferase 87 family protein [Myceligenerans halotolerans]